MEFRLREGEDGGNEEIKLVATLKRLTIKTKKRMMMKRRKRGRGKKKEDGSGEYKFQFGRNGSFGIHREDASGLSHTNSLGTRAPMKLWLPKKRKALALQPPSSRREVGERDQKVRLVQIEKKLGGYHSSLCTWPLRRVYNAMGDKKAMNFYMLAASVTKGCIAVEAPAVQVSVSILPSVSVKLSCLIDLHKVVVEEIPSMNKKRMGGLFTCGLGFEADYMMLEGDDNKNKGYLHLRVPVRQDDEAVSVLSPPKESEYLRLTQVHRKPKSWWLNSKIKLKLCQIYRAKGSLEACVDVIFPLIRETLFLKSVQPSDLENTSSKVGTDGLERIWSRTEVKSAHNPMLGCKPLGSLEEEQKSGSIKLPLSRTM
ncbi:hypothetical protein HAX54_019374 [Datura stramonium]|uniref:Uncharacterized protein n=1 Tax=Datura stramonium TaxID=4076 RepID=A0ABS8UR98_DATST|nr:hypothetical protein [Datura stramonium]